MIPSQKARIIGIVIGLAIIIGVWGFFNFVVQGPACKECPPGVNVCRNGTTTEVSVVLNQQPVFSLFVIPHPGDPATEEAYTDISTFTYRDDIYGRINGGYYNLYDSSFVGAGNLLIANPTGSSGATVTLAQNVNLPENETIMLVLGNSTRGIPIYNYGECETP